jgi:hypothetical protein
MYANQRIFNNKNDEYFFSKSHSLSKVLIPGSKGGDSRDIWRHCIWYDVVVATLAIID